MFDKILENVAYLKKLKTFVDENKTTLVQGMGIGEKAMSIYSLDRSVVLCLNSLDDVKAYHECFESLNLGVSELLITNSAPIYSEFKDQTQKQSLIKNLYDFICGKTKVLLVLDEALLYKFPRKINDDFAISLEVGHDYEISKITQKLVEIGYKKCQKVEKVGEFAVRGDILDIFSVGNDNPIRLDFFGDSLEEISTFDLYEMEKIEKIDSARIVPAKLFSLSLDEKGEVVSKIKNAEKNSKLQGDDLLKSSVLCEQICSGLEDGIIDDDEDFLKPFVGDGYSIFDITGDATIVVDEPKRLSDNLEEAYKSYIADAFDYVKSGELLQEHLGAIFSPTQALRFTPNVIFSSFSQKVFSVDESMQVRTVGSRNYTFDYKALIKDIGMYEKSHCRVIICAGDENSKQSLNEYLVGSGIFTTDNYNYRSSKAFVYVTTNAFPISCSFLDSGIIIIGLKDLIKRTKSEVRKGTSKKKKVFYLPKVGDFVVHELHGIGKCIELTTMKFGENEREYFVIEYAGGDKLYLPSEQANLISAYMAGDNEPKLNKIGGAQFAKIKQKVKESVSKLAINLLEIYSQREKSKGFVYSQDNLAFSEFENAFGYEETDDQLSAIADIKKDMCGTKIMDRLICGDVGYGKTEVALRAIYKAVLDGRQVAFLCPTTILSEQHYKTAKERFKNFAVNVAVINRFKTKSQQDEIIKETKDGKVDVLIGTHRLLSGDVAFKDLGLLVLDEEQRFGVEDKEKIKSLKQNVDVLTLSATPIPRTLNMALTGIRDISIIATPPKERIAVRTFVNEESDALILNACKKELARGGQVLYVYNRVQSIMSHAQRLRELLPEARVGVAHGQMSERELENTILKLYNGEYDILVATTLIESGIDLPLANTLIVIDADRLGLSELYQLRGRIGRSNRLAYAYFTYNPSKILTEDAYKRLDAILEFTELGSGFKIAMRDLEIRGAGDILGKEQHGHLEKVGYEMYCKLLEDAVKELKGEKVKKTQPIKVDILASASLPENYVESSDDRIKLYSDISNISSDEEYENAYNLLFETYGKLPPPAERLLKIAYIKNLGLMFGIKRILANSTSLMLYLYKTSEIMSKSLNFALSKRSNGVLKFEDVPIISFDMGMKDIDVKIDFLLKFLKDAKQIDEQEKVAFNENGEIL